MAALPSLITVAQFRQLPEDDGTLYELHHGEVVAVTRPRFRHSELQLRLLHLLERKLRAFGPVTIEFPYRPVPEFELRAADVAVVGQKRWNAIDPDDNLQGAPDLVIEVMSPSNTKPQLRELATLCLMNGAVEFWILDQRNRSITVIQRDGSSVVYTEGQNIPLSAFGAGRLAVSGIFSALAPKPRRRIRRKI